MKKYDLEHGTNLLAYSYEKPTWSSSKTYVASSNSITWKTIEENMNKNLNEGIGTCSYLLSGLFATISWLLVTFFQ